MTIYLPTPPGVRFDHLTKSSYIVKLRDCKRRRAFKTARLRLF